MIVGGPAAGERLTHEALEGDGGGADRVVPVDVAKHLVLGKQQRFESGDPLHRDADLQTAGLRVRQQAQRVQQPVHIDLTVRDAAKMGVSGQIFDLVQVQRAGDQSL